MVKNLYQTPDNAFEIFSINLKIEHTVITTTFFNFLGFFKHTFA